MSQGSLTIGSVSMATPAWKILDLSPLWGSANIRGEDVIIPGTAGRRFYPKTVDETTYRLPLVVFHGFDRTGTPFADPENGLQTNVEYLWTNVCLPTYTTLATATLLWPSGSSKTANVQCQLSDPGQAGEHLGRTATRFTFYVTVPAGRFA